MSEENRDDFVVEDIKEDHSEVSRTSPKVSPNKKKPEDEEEMADSETTGKTFRILGIVIAGVFVLAALAIFIVMKVIDRDNTSTPTQEALATTAAEDTSGWTVDDYINGAENALLEGNYGTAAAYYEKALETGSGHLEILLKLAEVYGKLDRTEDVDSCYTELVEKAEAADSLTEEESAALQTAYYHMADAYYEAGDSLMAYAYLTGKDETGALLDGYSYAAEITPAVVELHADGIAENGKVWYGTYPKTEVSSAVFDTLTFDEKNEVSLYGNTYYREEIAGTWHYFTVESLLWDVVKDADGNYLLMTDEIIDSEPFNESETGVDWADSSLRTYLSGNFTAKAFSEDESARLVAYANGASMNPTYTDNKSGKDVTDTVSVLSVIQIYEGSYRDFHAHMETNHEDYRAQITDYAVAKGGFVGADGYGRWWVRTMGVDATRQIVVGETGNFSTDGYDQNATSIGVRPAITLSKSNF